MKERTWHVDLHLVERDGTTGAEAILRTDAGRELRHHGMARRNPADKDVPEIGDELAVCRALAGLAHDLLEQTTQDVEANDPSPGEAHISLNDAG